MLEDLWIYLYHIDNSVFYFFNIYIHNSFLDFIMPLITYLGTPIFWIIICIIFYFFGGKKGKETAFICLFALILGYFATELLKYSLARPRPYEVLSGARHLMEVGGYSLPSGHTTAAFSAFTIFGIKYGYLYFFLILAALVAISRMYMGVHYPSDIILGAFLGIFCALVVLKYEEKLLRTKNKILNRNTD